MIEIAMKWGRLRVLRCDVGASSFLPFFPDCFFLDRACTFWSHRGMVERCLMARVVVVLFFKQIKEVQIWQSHWAPYTTSRPIGYV